MQVGGFVRRSSQKCRLDSTIHQLELVDSASPRALQVGPGLTIHQLSWWIREGRALL